MAEFRHMGLVFTALLGALASCGPDEAPRLPDTAVSSPSAVEPPQDCRTAAEKDSGSLIAICLSAEAKMRLAAEYTRRISDGSIMKPNGGFDPRYYPGEVIASVWALGIDVSDPRLIAWSEVQLAEIQGRLAMANGYLLWPDLIDGKPVFGELAQSRLVLSLGLIYRATGNERAGSLAVEAFTALDRLPRETVTSSVSGRSYQLPNYAYHDVEAPRGLSQRTLDPNHDAALAAAYLIMADHVLQDSEAVVAARQKGLGYLAAAVDLVTPTTCLPLADALEYQATCDTRYNGYWSFLLELVGQQELASARAAVDIQFAFVRPHIVSFQTQRSYPEKFSGPYPDPVEPVLWLTSAARNLPTADFHQFTQQTNALIEHGMMSAWPGGNLYPRFYE